MNTKNGSIEGGLRVINLGKVPLHAHPTLRDALQEAGGVFGGFMRNLLDLATKNPMEGFFAAFAKHQLKDILDEPLQISEACERQCAFIPIERSIWRGELYSLLKQTKWHPAGVSEGVSCLCFNPDVARGKSVVHLATIIRSDDYQTEKRIITNEGEFEFIEFPPTAGLLPNQGIFVVRNEKEPFSHPY